MRAVRDYSVLFRSLIAASLLLVSACTTTWVATRGGNEQDFASAKVKCQDDPNVVNLMSQATANPMSPASSWYAGWAQKAFKDCMREQGFVPQSQTNHAEVAKQSAPAPSASSTYHPPAASQPTSADQSATADIWYQCMKRNGWSDAAQDGCNDPVTAPVSPSRQAAGLNPAGKNQVPEPEPQNAKWNFLIKSTNGISVYIDVFDARVVGDKRRAWFKNQYPPQMVPVKNDARWSNESVFLQEFDCSQGNSSHSALLLAGYEHLSDGTTYVQPLTSSRVITTVQAGSVMEYMRNYLCGAVSPTAVKPE